MNQAQADALFAFVQRTCMAVIAMPAAEIESPVAWSMAKRWLDRPQGMTYGDTFELLRRLGDEAHAELVEMVQFNKEFGARL